MSARSSSGFSRRTVLRAMGVSMALPWLESADNSTPAAPPLRSAFLYFPNGCWTKNWFPKEAGANYTISPALKPLEKHRSQCTVLSGLNLSLNGANAHAAGEYYLSCCPEAGGYNDPYRNSHSVDQILADRIGSSTRFSSLTLGSEPGVGRRHRANTMSYNAKGRPIPVQADPRAIFSRMFVDNKATKAEKRKAFAEEHSIIDAVLDQAKHLNGQLGSLDKHKLDEYLSSVRDVEQQAEKAEKWLDVSKPAVSDDGLHLDATVKDPTAYMDTMLDLMVLALQTDVTRVCSYVMSREQFGPMQNLTQSLGISNFGHHDISHKGAPVAKEWTEIDIFFAKRFSRFLDKLQAIPEGDGTLLDHTIVSYGGANSTKHTMTNLPIVLAGGKKVGFKHGHYVKYNKVLLDNLWLSVLNSMGVETKTFAKGTTILKELYS